MTEEPTAPYAVAEVAQAQPLRIIPRVTVAAKTDLGRIRENNEDKYEFYLPESEAALSQRGLIFVLCDGMGGHAAGQIASELATKTFIDVFLNHPATEIETAMRAAIAAANRYVYDVSVAVPDRRGMGTTMSVLALVQDTAWIGQVGDSRVYRKREGLLTQLTTDHTWVEDVVAKGIYSREDAENHAYRHVLTRAVGTERDVEIDVFNFDLAEDDLFLLCSDGLTNHVSDQQISDLMDQSPSDAVWKLVGTALVDGGSDNCTVLLVRVNSLETQ